MLAILGLVILGCWEHLGGLIFLGSLCRRRHTVSPGLRVDDDGGVLGAVSPRLLGERISIGVGALGFPCQSLEVAELGEDGLLALQQGSGLAFQLFLAPGVLLLKAFLHHGCLTVSRGNTVLRVTSSLVTRGFGLLECALTDGVGLFCALGDSVAAGLLMGLGLFEQLIDLGHGLIVAGSSLCSDGSGFLSCLLGDLGSIVTSGLSDLGGLGTSFLDDL